MPTLKTKKGVAKRFKVTKRKKISYTPQNRGHLLSKKSSKRKRQLRRKRYVGGLSVKYIRRMLPNG